MLGVPGQAYHFEFTRAHGHDARAPNDNLVAFYIPDCADWHAAVVRMKQHGYAPVRSFNPFWDKDGVTFEDCDGVSGGTSEFCLETLNNISGRGGLLSHITTSGGFI